jgi:hypothetical protein
MLCIHIRPLCNKKTPFNFKNVLSHLVIAMASKWQQLTLMTVRIGEIVTKVSPLLPADHVLFGSMGRVTPGRRFAEQRS